MTSDLARIPLSDFIDRYWNPQPGQHAALVGPNGCGKTTIGMQLLAKTVDLLPDTTGVALVMKPHKGPKSRGRKSTGDPTVSALTKKLGGKVTRSWPPPPRLPFQREQRLWSYWPTHTMDPKKDAAAHEALFEKCLLDRYQNGDSVVFCDEAAALADDLKLDTEMKAILQRGRSMNCAAYLATQRPRFVPRAMFTESKHFFLWKMTDLAEYERVREIGGGHLTKNEIVEILQSLTKHQCLYLYPDEDEVAILT